MQPSNRSGQGTCVWPPGKQACCGRNLKLKGLRCARGTAMLLCNPIHPTRDARRGVSCCCPQQHHATVSALKTRGSTHPAWLVRLRVVCLLHLGPAPARPAAAAATDDGRDCARPLLCSCLRRLGAGAHVCQHEVELPVVPLGLDVCQLAALCQPVVWVCDDVTANAYPHKHSAAAAAAASERQHLAIYKGAMQVWLRDSRRQTMTLLRCDCTPCRFQRERPVRTCASAARGCRRRPSAAGRFRTLLLPRGPLMHQEAPAAPVQAP